MEDDAPHGSGGPEGQLATRLEACCTPEAFTNGQAVVPAVKVRRGPHACI